MMETLPSGIILHGRYRIERTLGSGGFGHVYLAIDLKTNQQLAIKEYLVTGSHGQEQLQHEANVLSQLHHPNLPAFQGSFEERGRYYVALSYIEGKDLTEYIRAARQRNEAVPLTRILTWMLTICDAVRFLHSQQQYVIHRDIKPDNIRIMPNGTAVLVDMGNAKAIADGARTLLFIRHQGTPGYAPPEQYPGGKGTDVRSDIYALGGTLFFALTAHEPPSVSTRNQLLQQGQPDLPTLQESVAKNPPEESEDVNAARQFRLGISRPAKPVPRHSRHLAQLGQLPAELLERLNNIIKRAMAMRPEKRYQSVVDFGNDLQSILAALPTQQPPARPARQANPYDTEPDLLSHYEAIQTAKENKEQEQASANAPANLASQPPSAPTPVSALAPTSQPSSSPPSYPTNCPRCGAELTPKAAFCSRCGYSLVNVPKANPTIRPPAEPNINPPAQNKAPEHDISSERTMMIAPQPPIARHAPMAGTPVLPDAMPRPFSSPPTSPASQNMSGGLKRAPQAPLSAPPPTQTRSPIQHVATPLLQNLPPTQGNTYRPPAPGSNSPTPAKGSRLNIRIILTVIFVLVILLILAIALFTLTRGVHATPGKGQRYSIEAQALLHERNCIALASTPAAVGIRACRAGIPAAAGITQRMAREHTRDTTGNQWHRLT